MNKSWINLSVSYTDIKTLRNLGPCSPLHVRTRTRLHLWPLVCTAHPHTAHLPKIMQQASRQPSQSQQIETCQTLGSWYPFLQWLERKVVTVVQQHKNKKKQRKPAKKKKAEKEMWQSRETHKGKRSKEDIWKYFSFITFCKALGCQQLCQSISLFFCTTAGKYQHIVDEGPSPALALLAFERSNTSPP